MYEAAEQCPKMCGPISGQRNATNQPCAILPDNDHISGLELRKKGYLTRTQFEYNCMKQRRYHYQKLKERDSPTTAQDPSTLVYYEIATP